MAIMRKNINSEDDFLDIGADATATFDNSPSNPTEHAGSENLEAQQIEDDDLEEDDEEEEGDDDLDDDEEDDDEEESEDEDYADEIDDEEEEDDDDDLTKGSGKPSAYRGL